MLRTLKRCDSLIKFDFSEFFVKLSANISKTRMFLDMQFFGKVKRHCDYDVKKSHKQDMSSFKKNLLQCWNNAIFYVFFAPFFYVLAHISPEWESIWICNFFEVIEWHKDYTLLKFWRNRFSHSWEKYDQNFKIFDFWQKLCIYLTINP